MTLIRENPILLFGLLTLATLLLSYFTPAQAADARSDIMLAADKTKSGEYVRQRFVQQMDQPFDASDPRKKMLIMGDSHAQDFYNALAENGIDRKFQVRTRRIPAICGLYLGPEDISPLIEKKHRSICDKADTLKAALPQIKAADVVILAANWTLWSAQRLKITVQHLAVKPPQRLLVIGRKDFGKLRLRQYLRLSNEALSQLRNPVYGQQHEINQTMRQTLPAGVFVDLQTQVCGGNGESCPVFTPQARLISFDGGHLTQPGAKYIGSILLRHPSLNQW